jgi:hypothetical protein
MERRMVGRATALAVVAAVGLGVSLGSGGQPSKGASSRSASNSASGDPSSESASGAGAVTGASVAPVPGGSSSSGVACPDSGTAVGNPAVVGSANHVLTRSTADGITIRVYEESTQPLFCGPAAGGASPPAVTCIATGYSIEISDSAAVGEGFVSRPPSASSSSAGGGGMSTGSTGSTESTGSTGATDASTEPEGSASGAFGVQEGDPVWWMAVVVGQDVSTVRARFSDGSSDSMTPVNGVAVLAHHIGGLSSSTDPYQVTGTLDMLDSKGGQIGSFGLPQAEPTPLPAPALPPAKGSSGAGGAPITATGTVSSQGASAPPASGPAIACPVSLPPYEMQPADGPPLIQPNAR